MLARVSGPPNGCDPQSSSSPTAQAVVAHPGGSGAWGETHCPLKDTVAVGPGQKIDIEFYADNPGHWFFHCHNLYHLAAGMARKFEYVV